MTQFTPHEAPAHEALSLPVAPPPRLFGRDTTLGQVFSLIRAKTPVLLYGASGIGKTTLAARLAGGYTETPGGSLWLRVSNDSLAQLVARVGRAYRNTDLTGSENPASRTRVAADLLSRNQPLIVLDGRLDPDAVAAFQDECATDVPLLLVSDEEIEGEWEARRLGKLEPESAVALFRHDAGLEDSPENDTITALVSTLNYVPFALVIAAATIREGKVPVAQFASTFPQSGGGTPNAQLLALTAAFRALPAPLQGIVLLLGATFTGGASAEIIGTASNAPIETINRAMEPLIARRLVERTYRYGEPYYHLHPITHTFAQTWLRGSSKLEPFQRKVLDALLAYVRKYSRTVAIAHDRLAAEMDQLMAAAEWAVERGDRNFVESVVAAIAQAGDFVNTRGYRYELVTMRELTAGSTSAFPAYSAPLPPAPAPVNDADDGAALDDADDPDDEDEVEDLDAEDENDEPDDIEDEDELDSPDDEDADDFDDEDDEDDEDDDGDEGDDGDDGDDESNLEDDLDQEDEDDEPDTDEADELDDFDADSLVPAPSTASAPRSVSQTLLNFAEDDFDEEDFDEDEQDEDDQEDADEDADDLIDDQEDDEDDEEDDEDAVASTPVAAPRTTSTTLVPFEEDDADGDEDEDESALLTTTSGLSGSAPPPLSAPTATATVPVSSINPDDIARLRNALTQARTAGDRRRQAELQLAIGAYHERTEEDADFTEAISAYSDALNLFEGLNDPAGMLNALEALARLTRDTENSQAAVLHASRGAALADQLKNVPAQIRMLSTLGDARQQLGETDNAISAYERALNLARTGDDPRNTALVLFMLGFSHLDEGNPQRAINRWEEALTLFRTQNQRDYEGRVLGGLGTAQGELGHWAEAINFHNSALYIARDVGDKLEEGLQLSNLGYAYVQAYEAGQTLPGGQNPLGQAVLRYRQALHLAYQSGAKDNIVSTTVDLVRLLLQSKRHLAIAEMLVDSAIAADGTDRDLRRLKDRITAERAALPPGADLLPVVAGAREYAANAYAQLEA